MATKYLLVFVTFIMLIVLIIPCNACEDALCEKVNAYFACCEKFVVGRTSHPTSTCCNNLKVLNHNVKYDNDGVRRYCSCIVNFSNSHDHPPYLQHRIEQLYVLCDVHLSFPISERMDCSK